MSLCPHSLKIAFRFLAVLGVPFLLRAQDEDQIDFDGLLKSSEARALVFPESSRGFRELRKARYNSAEHLWIQPELSRLEKEPEPIRQFVRDAAAWITNGYSNVERDRLVARASSIPLDNVRFPVTAFLAAEVFRMADRNAEAQKGFETAYRGALAEHPSS